MGTDAGKAWENERLKLMKADDSDEDATLESATSAKRAKKGA